MKIKDGKIIGSVWFKRKGSVGQRMIIIRCDMLKKLIFCVQYEENALFMYHTKVH